MEPIDISKLLGQLQRHLLNNAGDGTFATTFAFGAFVAEMAKLLDEIELTDDQRVKLARKIRAITPYIVSEKIPSSAEPEYRMFSHWEE